MRMGERRPVPWWMMLLLVLGPVGCVSPFAAEATATLPDRAPTIEGPIVAQNVEWGSVDPPSIHVKEHVSGECGIYFNLSGAEVLQKTADGSLREATIAELKVERQVRVWGRGPVLDSCPGQASAEVVLLLP